MKKADKKTKKTAAVPVMLKDKSKREEYITKLTDQLREWDQELKELGERSEKKVGRLRSDIAKNMERLRARRDELREKMSRVGEVSEESFRKIQTDAQKLWEDTQKGFSAIRKELKK